MSPRLNTAVIEFSCTFAGENIEASNGWEAFIEIFRDGREFSSYNRKLPALPVPILPAVVLEGVGEEVVLLATHFAITGSVGGCNQGSQYCLPSIPTVSNESEGKGAHSRRYCADQRSVLRVRNGCSVPSYLPAKELGLLGGFFKGFVRVGYLGFLSIFQGFFKGLLRVI